jgi:ABC-type glycerol-3-phosphate transport system permease component
VLVVGCVVFAFPFVWLATTSFKQNREIAVFPPRWIPEVPTYSTVSPFVWAAGSGTLERPDNVEPEKWDRLSGAIEATLWRALQRHLPAIRAREGVSSLAGPEDLRSRLTAAAWEEMESALPERAWADRPTLTRAVEEQTTPALALRAWERTARRLALGNLTIRDVRSDLVAGSNPKAWRITAGTASMRPSHLDREGGYLLSCDLTRDPVLHLQQTVRLPVPLSQVGSVSISLHADESWHQVSLRLDSSETAFVTKRPAFLDNPNWQDLTWEFVEPEDRTSRSLVLRRAEAGRDTRMAPGDLRLTLELRRSSRARVVAEKFLYNYRRALQYVPFWRFVWNSCYLVVLNVLGQLFACSLVAYAFARLRWYGRNVMFAVLLSTMMLPGQVTMVPVFIIIKWLGWYDTLRPLWVPSLFGSAFFIFLLRQFLMTIPRDLEDAAKIDGCGFFGIYRSIMLPLIGPALAVVAIFQFMGSWNDFMGPLIYLGNEALYPLSMGLFQFRQEYGGEWGMMMAASLLMTLPVIALFFAAQRYFIQGVTLTGIKG